MKEALGSVAPPLLNGHRTAIILTIGALLAVGLFASWQDTRKRIDQQVTLEQLQGNATGTLADGTLSWRAEMREQMGDIRAQLGQVQALLAARPSARPTGRVTSER